MIAKKFAVYELGPPDCGAELIRCGMKASCRALFFCWIFGLYILLLWLRRRQEERDSNQVTAASTGSLTSYSTALRAKKETAYSGRQETV
jgi:hypothetical protein